MSEENSLKVLVVEDHSFQLAHITNCLDQIGVEHVLTATDGVEGLECIAKEKDNSHPINLIICDLQMPNMDGIAFIRHLFINRYKGALIILTAMDASLVSSVTQLIKEYKIKFIGSLNKPVNTKTLITYITEAAEHTDSLISPVLPEGVSEGDLIHALSNGGLQSYFQPRFKFSDKSFAGVEALARLVLSDGRIIPPDDFLYLYEKLNKVAEFELQIYSQAFQLIKVWMQMGHPTQVSINISSSLLTNAVFYNDLLALIKHYGVPTDLVTIEVTERTLIGETTSAIEHVSRLRLNGFNLAIDDFGTGYSSFKQLELLPFNELKIDKSFMIGIESDLQKQAIVKSTVELAKRLNLTTVAEGVETIEAWEIAKEYGCDLCQGYLTGIPESKDRIKPQ